MAEGLVEDGLSCARDERYISGQISALDVGVETALQALKAL